MQDGCKGHTRIIGKRVAQRQGAVRRELGDEPFRQRLDGVVLFRFGLRFRRSGADCDDGTLGGAPRLAGGWEIIIASFDRFDRRLVFGTNIATLDAEITVAIDADEDPSARNLGGIVDDRGAPRIPRARSRAR